MNSLFSHITKGDNRSVKAKKNILYSFVFKAIDAVVYFLVVPVTLGYLDKYSYGIWLTLNSILLWINTFDAGLGNGMRNCLTVSLASDDNEKSRIYISTTYFLMSIIAIVVYTLFIVVSGYIDWYALFNVNPTVVTNLGDVIRYSFLFFCLSFVLRLIGSVYTSLQMPAVNYFLMAGGHLLSLIVILFLRFIGPEGSLLWVGIAYSASPCVIYFLAALITFGVLYKKLRPSFHFVKVRDYSAQLLNVGVNFFVIQISSLIFFSMSNVVISRLFGPDSVTPFNIANRYMAIILMAQNIVMAPIWSAVTDAHARGDDEWIKRSLQRVRKVTLLFGIALLLMLAISPVVYKLWVGNAVDISFMLSALMCIYTFILIWSVGHSSFLNGLNIMRLQLTVNVAEAILFLPLSIFFGRLWGLEGMVVAMILTNLPAMISNSVQVSRIINHTAKGLWLK